MTNNLTLENYLKLSAAEFNRQQLLRQDNNQTPLLCQCGFCEPCNTWECDRCHREMPWCKGQDDDYPETCDECWSLIAEGKDVFLN